jgi:hypothetical protein
MLKIFVLVTLLLVTASNAQATAEVTEVPKEVQQRVEDALDKLSLFAGLSEEQRAQLEPIMLDMLLQARVTIQDTETPLETKRLHLGTLLQTTRFHIEPLLTESQRAGFGMVWGRVSGQVMERLE